MQLSPQLYSRVASLLAPHPFVERRSEPRASVRGTARIVRGDAADDDRRAPRPVTVYVQDLSPGGAGLLSAAPVEAGEQLVLLMERAGWDGSGDGENVSLVCAAAYCRSLARDLYGIGIQFLRPGAAPDDAATAELCIHEFDALLQSLEPSTETPHLNSDAPPST